MKVIYSESHKNHKPTKEIWDGIVEGYLDIPARAYAIRDEIFAQRFGEFVEPFDDPSKYIGDIHDPRMIEFLKKHSGDVMLRKSEQPEFISESDESLSLTDGTYSAAVDAANCSLSGAVLILRGEEGKVYALCRPPGHHATRSKMGGFCFINNIAVAAKALSEHGKIAILDIDIHHGNGTQDILYDDKRSMFVSLNGRGVYPQIFEGRQSSVLNTERIVNFTIEPDMNDQDYLGMIDQAIDRIRQHGSDVILVSAGFDTSENELQNLEKVKRVGLSRKCYFDIGRMLRNTKLPTLVVQEGGYNIESLGKDTAAFLEGLCCP